MWLLRKIRENRRFAELEDRIERLERGHRSLDTEWNEYYDKLRHMMGRIAKRSAIIEKQQQEEEAEAGQSSPDEAASPYDDIWANLTPRQREIQQAILAERRRQ